MKEAALPVDKRLVHNREFTPAWSAQAFKTMMALPSGSRPTAVFCATDMMALGVIEAARREGLSLPDDLAVVGIDNNPEAAASGLPLTTIHSPFYEMGAQAGEMLRRLGEDPHAGPLRVLLEPKLVVRESSGKILSR
jgi:DNA-binding LacI/PurR family transcriptional regulator